MVNALERRFVVVSGLPGCGKSTLVHKLSPMIRLPVIDKDDILERLFEAKGTGDANHRRTLSRESDMLFRQDAHLSGGALLVSFWHLAGMQHDSGSPIKWLSGLSKRIVHLQCQCSPEVAFERFLGRKRHPGHLDDSRSKDDVLAGIAKLATLKPLDLQPHDYRRYIVEFVNEVIADQIWTAFEQ